MRWCIHFALILCLASSSYAQETYGRTARRGQASGEATRNATSLSMMGWGLGLAVGIAALCALIEDNSTASSGGGSNAH